MGSSRACRYQLVYNKNAQKLYPKKNCKNHGKPVSLIELRVKIVKINQSLVTHFLKAVGLYERGYHNALSIRVRHEDLSLPNLPRNFHNLRILFMSDLHIGGMEELPDIISEKIRDIEVDLCLLGGDYRFSFTHPDVPFLDGLGKVLSNIRASMGIYGVMGNHDDPDAIPAIERLGLRLLLNTSVPFERDGQTIHIVGVDDTYFYRKHDVKKAFQRVPKGTFSLCLSHTPDVYEEAEERGADLYLCGHTHHGQIRFPWLGALITFSSAPRSFSQGLWKHKNMTGYTGPGAGSSAPTVRFRCPPEILVLTLKSGRATS